MKKNLLLGAALLSVISAFPQNSRTRAGLKTIDVGAKIARSHKLFNIAAETPFTPPASTAPAKFTLQARTANTSAFLTTTTWNRYTGSENIYGTLVSTSRPLQYNDELGLISFVHRKSHTYQANPLPAATASTGVIVADFTSNWGASFDSTCLWSNNTNWGRYPQGVVYNPSQTNTSVSQAYIVGSGPTTSAADLWMGNWFASKKLDVFNSSASTVPGGQQFIGNSGTDVNGPTGKVDFARLDMAYTDNGKIHALGDIMLNANGTTFATQLTRGARVLHAAFNSSTSTFNWSGDSIIPPTVIAADGHPMLLGDTHMAWSEDGSIGYVFFIGCRTGATRSNVGNQPIVYKSTNGGPWTLVTGIDFNSTQMDAVKHPIPKVDNNSPLVIPFFNIDEGIDGIVDSHGKLHIMTTLRGTAGSSVDSLNISFQSTSSTDGQTYSYPHTPGQRPYIYDFVGDGSGPWAAILIDSMPSEAPGWAQSTDDGYNSNPWDVDPTDSRKVEVKARLQMSRTPDGNNIVYTWAESDTTVTTGSVKWNISPNIKARLLDVTSMTLNPIEISVTDPENINEANAEVRSFAFTHYTSPKCALSNSSTPGNPIILLPMTVSNNPAIQQREPVNHYFTVGVLNFGSIGTGIQSRSLNSAESSVIYPNPAKGSAIVSIDLKDNAKVDVTVINMIGQQVKVIQHSAQIGQNNINVDLNGLPRGIYMVNVKVGTTSSTKKLVVE